MAAFLRPGLVLGSGPLYLSPPTYGHSAASLIFLLTSLLLTLAPPTEVNVHSQLLPPVMSTHKTRVYSCRRSTRAMQGLTHSSHGPPHVAHTPDMAAQ